MTAWMSPVATVVYQQYGLFIPRTRWSVPVYVAAGGPFKNF
jgi:hypothetical protein